MGLIVCVEDLKLVDSVQSKLKREKEYNTVTLLEVLIILMTSAKENRLRSRKFRENDPISRNRLHRRKTIASAFLFITVKNSTIFFLEKICLLFKSSY